MMAENIHAEHDGDATSTGMIPVINQPLASDAGEYEVECVLPDRAACACIDRCGVMHEQAFAVVIKGDSMQPRLHVGDTVIFVPALEEVGVQPRDNDIVFVWFDGESPDAGGMVATLIFLGLEHYLLLKENRAYPPRHVRRKEIRQLAVAVQRRSDRF
jgi:SOS-response transcriptional repressor LexA